MAGCERTATAETDPYGMTTKKTATKTKCGGSPLGKLRVRMTNLASWRSAGDFARWYVVLGFLGGGVGSEPGLLIFDEVSGFVADVVDGLEG